MPLSERSPKAAFVQYSPKRSSPRSPQVGIGADAGDADEQIGVAHQLGEQHGVDVFERDRIAVRGHEAHLIRGQIIELEILLVHRRFDRLDPEFDLELALGHALERPAVAGVPAAEGRARPAARLAQGAEAALLDDMAGEAVRVGVRGALGVGQHIDLAVRLLERLRDPELHEALAPCEHVTVRPTASDARA